MTPARLPTWACWLLAACLTTWIVSVLAPGRSDLPSREWTGVEARDDGYWTSPLRRIAGAGQQDRYDERLALSLALPENALGVLAWRLGVPASDARFAGSTLALFAAILASLCLRRDVPVLMLAALLLTAPIFAHLRSDLGEGTAFGLASLFGLAMVRGRLALAAFVAAVGIFQKGCGLPLGVGVLAAVLLGSGRIERLRSAAWGAAGGIAVSMGVAALIFGDDPIAFVLRPFLATQETGAGTDVRSLLVRAAFPCAFEIGSVFIVLAGATWVALPHRRIRAPVAIAFLAGSLFASAFPDPWRMLPTWMLLPSLLAEPRSPDDGPAGRPSTMLLSTFLLAQTIVAGAHLLIGSDAHRLRVVAVAGVAAVVLDGLRRRWPASRPVAIACVSALALVSAIFFTGPIGLIGASSARSDFARSVAARVPPDAHLIGYSFLAKQFHGTLYYPPFQPQWEGELAAAGAPATIYRIRSRDSTAPPPKGYVVEATEDLGPVPYGRSDPASPAVLERMRKR